MELYQAEFIADGIQYDMLILGHSKACVMTTVMAMFHDSSITFENVGVKK